MSIYTRIYTSSYLKLHPPPIIRDDPSKSVWDDNFLTDLIDINLSRAMTSLEGGRHSGKYKKVIRSRALVRLLCEQMWSVSDLSLSLFYFQSLNLWNFNFFFGRPLWMTVEVHLLDKIVPQPSCNVENPCTPFQDKYPHFPQWKFQMMDESWWKY